MPQHHHYFLEQTIFADVDRDSGAITPNTIATISKKTKAIAVVHLGGWPAEMESISKLAKANNIALIEDCSQAHGAFISGKSGRVLVILVLGVFAKIK